MTHTGVLTVDKEHKKLLNSVRSICEALELMGEDVTERVAKSENRMLSYMDGRLSRELRAITAVQTELLAKLDRQDKALERILDRLPEADEMEGLRRRVRYLERALQDHVNVHEDDPFDVYESGSKYEPSEEYGPAGDFEESGRNEPARPARSEAARQEYAESPRVDRARYSRGESTRYEREEPSSGEHGEPPRVERGEPIRFARFDRPARSSHSDE